MSSCEKKDDSVVDPSYFSPSISNLFKSKDTVFTTSASPSIVLNTAVSVSENGGGSIESVTCKVYAPDNSLLGTFQMSDNGAAPDSVSGDGRYSCTVNVNTISCLLVGNYSLQYAAKNTSGLNSNSLSSNLRIVNTANLAPVVSSLIAPDTIHVPATGQTPKVLTVKVNDANGNCDVQNVFFKSYRPDGTQTNSGNPFTMFDDGDIPLHGDTVAGDGRYSLIIAIPSTQTTLGPFRFVYRARDNSNAVSDSLQAFINVVQP